MGKLLRVLTVLFLVLSVTALVFAVHLFERRELLKGRTQILENAIHAIAATVEHDRPTPDTVAGTFPERDRSECSSVVLAKDEIERSAFWAHYRKDLEESMSGTFPVDNNVLMQLYLTNELGEVQKDPGSGRRIVEGPGTMASLLDSLVETCAAQHGQLNATRQELSKTRQELVSTIEDLNLRKGELRADRLTIVRRNETIAARDQTIDQQKNTIAAKDETIYGLRGEVTDCRAQIEALNQTVEDKDYEIERRDRKIEDLVRYIRERDGSGVPYHLDIPNGIKGEIAAVNTEYGFVVIKINDEEFVREALPYQKKGARLNVPVWIQREAPTERYIARMLVKSLNGDTRLAVAEIDRSWLLELPKVGDGVYYQ